MTIKLGDIVELNGLTAQAFKFYTNERDGRDFVKVACFMSNGEWPVNRFPLWPTDKVEKIKSGMTRHLGDIDRREAGI